MDINIFKIILIILIIAIVGAVGLALFIRWMGRKEPYRSFMNLPTRRKMWFLKGVVTDRRIPWFAKALVPLTLLYLAVPFDIIPDFIPVLGEMDDVAVVLAALALFIRLCPRKVMQEHLERALNPQVQ